MRGLKLMSAVFACVGLLACSTAAAQHGGAPPAPAAQSPYAPYEFLIGDWDTGDGIVQRFSWGPSRGYILYSTMAGDHLHFEGMMIYNAAQRNLDVLIALEPGSFGQEKGTLSAQPDGTLVREVTLIGGDGATSHFRQTFRRTGADTAVTSLMRQGADGAWSPNFPGADNLAMTRRR